MRKLLLIFSLLSLPSYSAEKIRLNPDTDYIYFSNSKINDVKSSNSNVIEGKSISSYTGENSQILFSSFSSGSAKIDINTDKGTISYDVEVCMNSKNKNDIFVEVDVPEMKSES